MLMLGRKVMFGPHLAGRRLSKSSAFFARSFSSAVSSVESSDRSSFVFTPLVASALLAAGVWSLEKESYSTKLDAAALIGSPEVQDPDGEEEEKETTDVINWSGTHMVTIDNDKLWEPESVEEVEAFVRECQRRGQAIRPIGSSLSPNGIALNPAGMIQMANIDRVLEIDTENKTITVEAGITVQRVVEALRPHGLTLPNLASIAEQQMGGFTQVGAHGTGKAVAPVDHYVTRLKLVTPGLGTIVLSKEENGRLFELAKVAVGCLGVVVEVTMQCIPAHNLLEHTFVLTRQQAKEQLDDLLKNHKHMRYMWIPYTDTVVCVTNDPEHLVPKSIPRNRSSRASPEEKMRPLTNLLATLCKENGTSCNSEDVNGMGFGELRDALLAFAPLDIEHVKRCNQAEAEFWSKNEGYQTKPSDQLLQFDCGGQVSKSRRSTYQVQSKYCAHDDASTCSNGYWKCASRQEHRKSTMAMIWSLWKS
jgi:L-galactono-1,4-lactone dehydrogenase